jgi:hypothetical protein
MKKKSVNKNELNSNESANNEFIEADPVMVDGVSQTPADKPSGTIDRRKAFVKTVGAVLGGAAAASILQSNSPVEVLPDDTSYADALQAEITDDGITESLADDTTAMESAGFDPNTAPVATSVTKDMDFEEAFAAARHETGPGGVFMYQGQYYNTFYAEELNDEGHPVVEYDSVPSHDLPEPEYTQDEYLPDDSTQSAPENTGGGNQGAGPNTMAIDSNADGSVDAVFVDINEDGSADAMFSDLNQDGSIVETEVQYIHDPQTLQTPEQAVDGTQMSIDTNADGVDDVVIMDANTDQYADAIGTDADNNQQIDQNEVVILNEEALGAGAGSVPEIEYQGEVSDDMPEDVPDSMIDEQVDDVTNLSQNFDEYNEWA